MLGLSEFVQEFVTEVKGLTLRLVFKLYIIPLDEYPKESMYYLVHAKVKIFY
jgi:hypothetical protein